MNLKQNSSGAKYHFVVSFPLYNSLRTNCLSIFQPTNIEMKRPPAGRSMFDERKSQKSKIVSPKMRMPFNAPNDKEQRLASTMYIPVMMAVALWRGIMSCVL